MSKIAIVVNVKKRHAHTFLTSKNLLCFRFCCCSPSLLPPTTAFLSALHFARIFLLTYDTEVPPVVINEPVTLPEVMPVSSLLPAGSKSRIPVKAAGLEKLPAVQTSSSSTPSVSVFFFLSCELPERLAHHAFRASPSPSLPWLPSPLPSPLSFRRPLQQLYRGLQHNREAACANRGLNRKRQ